MTRTSRHDDRGSVVPLMAALLLIGCLLVLGSARLGSAAIGRARADSVADVVALAAASGGEGGAASVAEANGASLVDHVVRDDRSTRIQVRLRSTTAVAAAAPAG